MVPAPKNLSRRPRKTCSPARAKNHSGMSGRFRSNSTTSCRVKRTCTYDSQTRLESCSRDPIGYEGSPWNLYEYVSGSPTANFDPTGLWRPCRWADLGKTGVVVYSEGCTIWCLRVPQVPCPGTNGVPVPLAWPCGRGTRLSSERCSCALACRDAWGNIRPCYTRCSGKITGNCN